MNTLQASRTGAYKLVFYVKKKAAALSGSTVFLMLDWYGDMSAATLGSPRREAGSFVEQDDLCAGGCI